MRGGGGEGAEGAEGGGDAAREGEPLGDDGPGVVGDVLVLREGHEDHETRARPYRTVHLRVDATQRFPEAPEREVLMHPCSCGVFLR